MHTPTQRELTDHTEYYAGIVMESLTKFNLATQRCISDPHSLKKLEDYHHAQSEYDTNMKRYLKVMEEARSGRIILL